MKGFLLTENEKKQIKKLYSNFSLLREQVSSKDTCLSVEVTGAFKAMVTENDQNLLNFIKNVVIKATSTEEAKKAYEEGKLYLADIKLLGGASNVYQKKAVRPTMTNDYTPQEYADDKNKYPGDFSANLKLAEDRAKNVWTKLQTMLPEKNIKVNQNIQPTYESYVIDTGGHNDSYNINNGIKLNRGQIVKATITMCYEGGGTDVKKCFESAIIEVSYTPESADQTHRCNNAVYQIYANGVPLISRNKHGYASLNNQTVGGNQIYPPDTTASQKNRNGGNYVYNYFDLSIDGDNKAFFNEDNMYMYDGGLVVDAKCLSTEYGKWSEQEPLNPNKKTDCHNWVGQIKLKVSDGVQVVDVGNSQLEGTGLQFKTPNMFSDGIVHLAGFEACKKTE